MGESYKWWSNSPESRQQNGNKWLFLCYVLLAKKSVFQSKVNALFLGNYLQYILGHYNFKNEDSSVH